MNSSFITDDRNRRRLFFRRSICQTKSDDRIGHLNTILARGGVHLNDPIFKRSNARGLPGGMLNFRFDRRISFSLFDRHDSDKPEMIYISCSLFNRSYSDKPEKINISPHCGCYLWTLSDHKTILVVRIETSLNLEGSEFSGCCIWTLADHNTFQVIKIETSLNLEGSEFSWHFSNEYFPSMGFRCWKCTAMNGLFIS